MKHEPYFQGHFDGTCGMYSIINAYDHVKGIDSFEEGEELVAIMTREARFDEIMRSGASRAWVHRAISTIADVKGGFDFKFASHDAPTVDEMLFRFKEHLTPTKSCVIIGIEDSKLGPHWTVLTSIIPTMGRLYFRDSWGMKSRAVEDVSLPNGKGKFKINWGDTIFVKGKT